MIALQKVPLRIWKILRLFVNTLTADDKYAHLNRDNVKEPIKILLSQTQNGFSPYFFFFFAVLKLRLNFEHFPKKENLHR